MVFGNLDARPPSKSSLASSTPSIQNPPVAPQPGPRFADFQFRTIGQQPELLKRISAPNPDTHYDNDSDLPSPSFSLQDQSIQTLTSPETDNAKRPSLRDRLSLLQSPTIGRGENIDVTMANPLENGPAFDSRSAQRIDVAPMVTSTTQAPRLDAVSSPLQGPSVISRTAFPQSRTLGKEPDMSQNMISLPAFTESRFPMITGSETETRISPPIIQSLTQASGTSGVSTPISSGEAMHSLMALRTLQSRLSSSLSNFNPISTADALTAAQSAKDQCTEVLATAHRAHALAQQASLLAQDSLVAAQECLNVAATVQSKADLALSAVEKIRSGQGIGGGEWEYNATIKALKDDLHQLAQWVSQRDTYESKYLRREEREIEKHKKKSALELEHGSNKFLANKKSCDLLTHSEFPGMRIGILETGITTVEDEADAATRAWNQHREQSAERKRLAGDELRKHREVEAELERQRLQAQSEADAREAELESLRVERLNAEEQEKFRQEKEALECQLQHQELQIARFLRSQKQVHDDQARVAAEEKERAQAAEAEKEARLIAEHEQKRKEIHEKELLKRHDDAEKAKRCETAQHEAKRREVILERMKGLAVEAPKSPICGDTVDNILDKAKEKQSMVIPTTPPSQHAPLPHQASAPSGLNHGEFGNVVSKKTLFSDSPRTFMQHDRILSGSIRLDESTNSIHPTSLISSSSTAMPKGVKSHEGTSNIPSSIDKRLLPDSTNRIREVNRKSGDGASNIGSSRLPSSSSSPLTPLSEGNSSLPINFSSRSPATNLNDFEDVYSELNIHSNGPDMGNVSVLPPSRVLPVSLEAQRANLRPFMDASGITSGPGISDVNEQKGSADQPSVTHERPSLKPLSSSQTNGDQICRTSSAALVKLEPINDVSALSMPPPPAIMKVMPTGTAPAAKSKLPDFKKINETAPETLPSSKGLPPFPQTMPPPESFAQPPGPANSSIVLKEKVRPAAVRRNVPPLSNEQLPTLADTSSQTFQANDSHPVSPRMGPDAAVTDGWAQMGDDPMAKRQRKHLPRSLDRSSPPRRVPSGSRLPPKRPRGPSHIVLDHYSPPRRFPDSLPSQNDYARDGRRSGSAEYTQGLSPQVKYNEERKSLSPDDVPTIGRKRYRDDNSFDPPPPRRHRYDSPPLRQNDYVQPSSYQPPDAAWDRAAIYGRSPSPESRTTPLALRLGSEKPWNSQGGSSYRPSYNDSDSYAYDSQTRHTDNQRYSAPHPQSIPHGTTYYGEASTQFNQQRQFGRNDITNDTRLPLLSRFTDSTERNLPPFNNHHGPSRPRIPRGRGGGNQALEQRISRPKTISLINRLEDANESRE